MIRLVNTLALGLSVSAALTAVDNDPFAAFENDRIAADSQLRWGGYGEMHYNNFQGGDKATQFDLHRLVFLAEYQFDEKISFFTEIEIEHAFVSDGEGELEVEQAYLDYSVSEQFGIRGGMLLVPISIMNLYHEPTLFYGVERPFTQKQIIPTTWFDAGISFYGKPNDQLSYEVAIQAGLDQGGFDASGVRGGRQKGYESKAEDLMITARLDYRPSPEVWLAAAINTGESDQDPLGDEDAGMVTMITLEGRYEHGPYKAGLSYAQVSIADAEDVAPGVSESLSALEIFAGVDIIPFINDTRSDSLAIFVRYETFDSQEDVPNNVAEDESKIGTVITIGLDYKPHPNVVVKLDYQDFESDDDSMIDQWNLGIGWMF